MRFGSQVSVVHFIGRQKPWRSIPYPDVGTEEADQPATSSPLQRMEGHITWPTPLSHDRDILADYGRKVYDRYYYCRTNLALGGFQVPTSINAWNPQTFRVQVTQAASSLTANENSVLRLSGFCGHAIVGPCTSFRNYRNFALARQTKYPQIRRWLHSEVTVRPLVGAFFNDRPFLNNSRACRMRNDNVFRLTQDFWKCSTSVHNSLEMSSCSCEHSAAHNKVTGTTTLSHMRAAVLSPAITHFEATPIPSLPSADCSPMHYNTQDPPIALRRNHDAKPPAFNDRENHLYSIIPLMEDVKELREVGYQVPLGNNAWDVIPNIQKYASKLAHHSTLRNFSLPASVREKGPVNYPKWTSCDKDDHSMDGDVEDEDGVSDVWSFQLDHPRSPRGGTTALSDIIPQSKTISGYLSRCVQTIVPEGCDKGIQVSIASIGRIKKVSNCPSARVVFLA